MGREIAFREELAKIGPATTGCLKAVRPRMQIAGHGAVLDGNPDVLRSRRRAFCARRRSPRLVRRRFGLRAVVGTSPRSNFRRTVELSLGDSQAEPTEGWLTYRFPIRDGVAAEMRLPADLTIAEARRLATLITALPVDAT